MNKDQVENHVMLAKMIANGQVNGLMGIEETIIVLNYMKKTLMLEKRQGRSHIDGISDIKNLVDELAIQL